MEDYGDWMLDRREFHDAALAFELSGKTSKAMMAYEKAHAWRPLFTLAMKSELDEEKFKELSYRVAGMILCVTV
jgi:elongator complex protein 1